MTLKGRIREHQVFRICDKQLLSSFFIPGYIANLSIYKVKWFRQSMMMNIQPPCLRQINLSAGGRKFLNGSGKNILIICNFSI